VRTRWNLAAILPLFILLVSPLRGDDPKPSANANSYLYATTTCIGGEGGPGVRVFLKQFRQCQGNTTYPYLRIDIREQSILAQKNIAIGGGNSAVRCLSARQSCDEAISGNILFDHFEEFSGKEIKTDGYYELKFKNGKAESGLFKVDCMAPCS
jgi:hypothetical protein